MGLWKSRSRTEEQREKSVVEKIRTGKSVQCRCGLRDPDESTDMDRIRTSGGFSDPLMDCKECNERFRADKLIEDFAQEHGIELKDSVDSWSQEEMAAWIEEHNVPCTVLRKT